MLEGDYPKQFGPDDAISLFCDVSRLYPANFVQQSLAMAIRYKDFPEAANPNLSILFQPANRAYLSKIRQNAINAHMDARRNIIIPPGLEYHVLAEVCCCSEILRPCATEKLTQALNMGEGYKRNIRALNIYLDNSLTFLDIDIQEFRASVDAGKASLFAISSTDSDICI